MKKSIFILVGLATFLCPSCIQDEAPNSEADILSITISEDILLRSPIITNDAVTVWVQPADLTALSPEFEITEGATITPASGTTLDFSNGQTHQYTVTSEDRMYSKTYTVFFSDTPPFEGSGFENIIVTSTLGGGNYHEFIDTLGVSVITWGSGNAGFSITMSKATATEYPTSQSSEGYVGNCAQLVTRSTGSLGALFGAPIAAGNLFLGSFETNFSNTLLSTHFGIPSTAVPISVSGYYKYAAGDKYTDASGNVMDTVDDFAIYAVFFETDDETEYLDGTNVKTHENVVALADLADEDHVQSDEWTEFTIYFETINGKTIDEDKLASGDYSLTLVFSSSKGGDTYEGAVGSTLLVDEVTVSYK